MPFHDFIRETDGWRTVENDTLFANPYLEVHRVTVTSPTQSEPFQWTVAHRKSAVVVVPETQDAKFLLIRQERVPIRATIWEFPAGQIDDLEEPDSIRATGLRELREESGHELAPGGEVIPLGHFFPSSGFTDEHSHLLLARPVIPSVHGHRGSKPCSELSSRRIVALCDTTRVVASGRERTISINSGKATLPAERRKRVGIALPIRNLLGKAHIDFIARHPPPSVRAKSRADPRAAARRATCGFPINCAVYTFRPSGDS